MPQLSLECLPGPKITEFYPVADGKSFLRVAGQKRPFWELLDGVPRGWLMSIAAPSDYSSDIPIRMLDCGSWNYRKSDIPPADASKVARIYRRLDCLRPGILATAPDHMLIDGVNLDFRRQWNLEQATKFLDVCPASMTPTAVIHGQCVNERLREAAKLVQLGYRSLAIGGLAARASQRKKVLFYVRNLLRRFPAVRFHVFGLAAESYYSEWLRLKVDSVDGASFFSSAFTGRFWKLEDPSLSLKVYKAVGAGEPDRAPRCDCRTCSYLRSQGVDTRTFGSNEHNMGRAVHNLGQLLRSHENLIKRLKLILVSCCGKKLKGYHKAGDIYQSDLFLKSRAWAEKNGDSWAILSAKYGVLPPDRMIQDYDITLKSLSASERALWNRRVRLQLTNWRRYQIIVLAGEDYCNWIDSGWGNVEKPLQGLGIGERLAWLNKELEPDNDDEASSK